MPEPVNKVRFELIEAMKKEMEESWGYPPEETAIIVTAFIAKFRFAYKCGGFEVLMEQLVRVIKPEERHDV